MDTLKSHFIPTFCLFNAFALSIFLFLESRNDPSLRIAALVSVTGLINTYTAVASTMLTGRDLTYSGNKPPTTITTDPSSTTTVTTPTTTVTTIPIPKD